MVQLAADASAPGPVDPDLLVEALLYSVAHDLRSPLLTLSLAGELISESLGARLRDEPSTGLVALDALVAAPDAGAGTRPSPRVARRRLALVLVRCRRAGP